MSRGAPTVRLTTWVVVGGVLAVTVARLAFAAAVPLTEDEAYYRLWSMRWQLGYFDHPPMIAWWIGAGRSIAGDAALGIRLLPVLAWAATSWLLADTLRALGAGPGPALRAAVWLNATLLVGAGAILAIPDSATALFWTATLWALARAGRPGAGLLAALGWWTAAGAAAGLAVLSKYSALFLGPGVLLWLCSSAENRRRLMTPGPWLAAFTAATVLAPHLLWNAQNGWVSVLKQFGRVGARSFEPGHVVEFFGGQLLLLNPIIAIFGLLAVFGSRVVVVRSPLSLLALTGAPFAVYLVAHALHDPVQAHWPAPVYPTLAGLAAVAAERVRPDRKAGERWRRAAPMVGLGVSGLVLSLAALPTLDAATGPTMRPLRGWPEFAKALQTQVREGGGPAGPPAWIGTASYGLAAQLQAEPDLILPIVQLNDRSRYDPLPPSPAADFARPGLVVDLPRRITAEALRRCFAQVLPLAPLVRNPDGPSAAQATYAVFKVSGPIRLTSGGCTRQRDLVESRAAS